MNLSPVTLALDETRRLVCCRCGAVSSRRCSLTFIVCYGREQGWMKRWETRGLITYHLASKDAGGNISTHDAPTMMHGVAPNGVVA